MVKCPLTNSKTFWVPQISRAARSQRQRRGIRYQWMCSRISFSRWFILFGFSLCNQLFVTLYKGYHVKFKYFFFPFCSMNWLSLQTRVYASLSSKQKEMSHLLIRQLQWKPQWRREQWLYALRWENYLLCLTRNLPMGGSVRYVYLTLVQIKIWNWSLQWGLRNSQLFYFPTDWATLHPILTITGIELREASAHCNF